MHHRCTATSQLHRYSKSVLQKKLLQRWCSCYCTRWAPLLHLPALLPLDQRELLKLRGVRVQSFDVKELVDVEEFDFESEVRVWRNQAAGSSIAVRVVWIHRGFVSSVARGLVSLKEWVWGVDS